MSLRENKHSFKALVKLENDANSIEGNLTKPKSHTPLHCTQQQHFWESFQRCSSIKTKQDMHQSFLPAASFTITKYWKQPKSPTTEN